MSVEKKLRQSKKKLSALEKQLEKPLPPPNAYRLFVRDMMQNSVSTTAKNVINSIYLSNYSVRTSKKYSGNSVKIEFLCHLYYASNPWLNACRTATRRNLNILELSPIVGNGRDV